MSDNHIERVNKIRRLVEEYDCGNEKARDVLKTVDWCEQKASAILDALNVQNGKKGDAEIIEI